MHPGILTRGQFMGDYRSSRRLPDFSLAHLVPTVPEDGVREHAHAEAHYVLFLEGAYVSSAAGAPTLATRPMLIYNPPGTLHRDRFRGEGGRFFTLSVGAIAPGEGAPVLPQHPLVLDAIALTLARRLAAMARDPRAEPLSLESLSHALMGRTAERLEAVLQAAPAWLRRTCEKLRDECGRDLSMAEVAREAGVHPVHLTRVFRAQLRRTPGEYLRRCRLDKAAALLAAGRLRLVDVAQACGYFDQAHFSHAFRAAYGMAPRDYRRAPG